MRSTRVVLHPNFKEGCHFEGTGPSLVYVTLYVWFNLSFSSLLMLQNVSVAGLTCCPCFILATAGPYFMVLGAAITQSVLVQPLTPFIRAVGLPLDEAHYRDIARTLYSLNLGVKRLKQFWESVTVPSELHVPTRRRFFPWRQSYVNEDGHGVHFTYEKHLEREPSSVTFLARITSSSKLIVVKFTEKQCYGEIPHKLLAAKGYALELRYVGPLAEKCQYLWMIVMDYVDGEVITEQTVLPRDFQAQMETILQYLHSHGYVFGDLRKQNVMIDRNDKAKLIDLDWCAQHDKGIYPLRMNPGIPWVKGMGPLQPMKKEHDWAMYKRFF